MLTSFDVALQEVAAGASEGIVRVTFTADLGSKGGGGEDSKRASGNSKDVGEVHVYGLVVEQ